MRIEISADLREFLTWKVSDGGPFRTASAYVEDLIRRDMERSEAEATRQLTAELTSAFSAPDHTYRRMTAADVIARNA
jgi:antitoxin ParD1/3/4